MAADPVGVLRAWQDAGAVWRVVARTPTSIEIALLTCTGDEEVERITSSDARLLEFVGRRSGSDD